MRWYEVVLLVGFAVLLIVWQAGWIKNHAELELTVPGWIPGFEKEPEPAKADVWMEGATQDTVGNNQRIGDPEVPFNPYHRCDDPNWPACACYWEWVSWTKRCPHDPTCIDTVACLSGAPNVVVVPYRNLKMEGRP